MQRMRFLVIATAAGIAWSLAIPARAQLSLTSAVDLALRNSPRVRSAQADVDKARATLSQTHDAFVPSISTSGGVGKSTGVPLGLPVIFSISAQSLIFNFSQPDYVRAAHAGLDAAQLALTDVQLQVAEDAASTYVSLDNAFQRQTALEQTADVLHRLTQILEQRYDAGLEPHIEVTRNTRTAAQVRLQQMLLEDEIAEL